MDIKKLRWAVRRGMLELDLILGPFLDNVYPTLDESNRLLFHKLLECEDQDMFKWFLRNELPTDPDIQKIVEIILLQKGRVPHS